jgi:hypothetical protein
MAEPDIPEPPPMVQVPNPGGESPGEPPAHDPLVRTLFEKGTNLLLMRLAAAACHENNPLADLNP